METLPIDVPILLLEPRVNADAREVAGHEELVKLDRTCNRLHEDDDLNSMVRIQVPQSGVQCDANLVELQSIQELVQLLVLLDFLQLDVVLLETVKSEFRLVIDKDFQRLSTDCELRAKVPDIEGLRWP